MISGDVGSVPLVPAGKFWHDGWLGGSALKMIASGLGPPTEVPT